MGSRRRALATSPKYTLKAIILVCVTSDPAPPVTSPATPISHSPPFWSYLKTYVAPPPSSKSSVVSCLIYVLLHPEPWVGRDHFNRGGGGSFQKNKGHSCPLGDRKRYAVGGGGGGEMRGEYFQVSRPVSTRLHKLIRTHETGNKRRSHCTAQLGSLRRHGFIWTFW